MFCLLNHFYIYVITCAYCYIEYTRNQEKLIKPKKKTIKPKKPNPYPIKGQTGIGFFGLHPPPQFGSINKVLARFYIYPGNFMGQF